MHKSLVILFAVIASTCAAPLGEAKALADITENLNQMLINLLTNLVSSINLGKRDVELTRGLTDIVLNKFGLGSVWDKIQSVGSNLSGQLINVLASIIFKGKKVWDLATPVLAVMITDLKDNSVSAAQAVAQAVADLANIAAGNTTPKGKPSNFI